MFNIMISTLSSLYCVIPMISNYNMVNLPNIYNLLISILLLEDIDENEILQMIKLNMGMTFYDGFKQYIIKKYPLSHILVKMVNQ